MKNSLQLWKNPGAEWIWLQNEFPNQFVAALCEFSLPEKASSAEIAIFADTKYKLYINGRFVNAGPAPFWKPPVMIDEYEIQNFLQKGKNTILVIACFVGADTKYNMKELPGIIASVKINCKNKKYIFNTGKDWKITQLNCWHRDTPRRNWAIEQIEDLNLQDPDFSILSEYANQDYFNQYAAANFAKVKWQKPRCFERPDIEIRRRIVPLLRWETDTLTLPRTIFRGNTELYNWQDTAVRLDHEYVWPEFDEAQYEQTRDGIVKFQRKEGEPGFLILYDFKRMMAGDPAAEIYVSNPCRLEFAMAEDLTTDGRPIIWRNGGHYYARFHLQKGLNRIRFYHFNGYRFLFLVFKDLVGKAEIRKVMSKSCRADLDYQDEFSSNDRLAESVYRISRRSIKLNTQAFAYDCNTREQGTYWGDGVWITESVGHMTGNFSHLRHLCLAANDEIKKSGPLLNASLFGMAIPLLDYCLVPPIALARYYKFTADIETVKLCINTTRAIIEKFREFRNKSGFITQENIKKIMGSDFKGFLFLDHQGNGWHPMTTVGLDRRDINSGFNLYYLEALQSISLLEKALGNNTRKLDEEICSLTENCRKLFYIHSKGLIADAAGEQITDLRFSQISNALAIMTGVLSGEEANHALKTVLDIKRHTWISMGTPYSYFFLAEAAAKCPEIAAETVIHFNEAFREHLERGATTTWESWRAENHDSRNHAWSAPMPHLIRRAIAGIEPIEPGYKKILIRPVCSSFDYLNLTVMTPPGKINIQWEKCGIRKFNLKIYFPENSSLFIKSADNLIEAKKGSWNGIIQTT